MAETRDIHPADIPTSPDYTETEVTEFIALREAMLEFGFSGCNVKFPTKQWHGTRVEAFVDVEDKVGLPFIKMPPYHNRLQVWMLRGCSAELCTGTADMEIGRYVRLGGTVVDQEIKQTMARIAELGRELAYGSFGFPPEYPWIQPMEPVEVPVKLCADNPVRRYKEAIVKATTERQTYWQQLGWLYFIEYPTSHDTPGIKLSRYIKYNPGPDTLENCLQTITCGESLEVSAALSPDVGSRCVINPIGPLTLEELAELQIHTKAEFESGSLNPRYLEYVLPKIPKQELS